MKQLDKTDRSNYVTRKSSLQDQIEDDDLSGYSTGERMEMVWQLTKEAWAFMGVNVSEQRLSRHIVRIHRGEG